MGEANIVDTEILLDIVYQERPDHQDAMEFFNRYGKQGLALESNVNRMCQRILLKQVGRFVKEFGEMIQGKDEDEGNATIWDQADTAGKEKMLENYKVRTEESTSMNDSGYRRFSLSIVEKAKSYLIRMDSSHIRQYLQILTASLTDYLSTSIKENFSYLVPVNSTDGKDTVNMRRELYDYFSIDARENAVTLANLISLILYGNSAGKNYISINFFTSDRVFIENFRKIKEDLNPEDLDRGNHVKAALKSITLEKPY
jgi:predicted nucleic acid-binding protein